MDWDTEGFNLAPVAPQTGPFAGRDFLEVIWRHHPAGELWLTEAESALLPLTYGPGGLSLVGHADLVDYRSPRGPGSAELVAGAVSSLPAGQVFHFDSLPVEAAAVVADGLALAGLAAEPHRHAIAAVLQLPDEFEGWLQGIDKKERHELRRKRRRFAALLGEPQLTTERSPGEGLEHFIRMHRDSKGDKGEFMTTEMESFFADLLSTPGWQVDLLIGEHEPVAAAFGWVGDDGYYLYNSAYYQDRSGASPGMVLIGMLIEGAIAQGSSVFDFLKGDEAYKFRLGARPRPLYEFRGTT